MPRDLYLTSPPVAGADVRRLQEGLRALGYSPGPVDGIYGLTTANAVRDFQRDAGLEADGVVGERTRAALESSLAAPPPPPPPTSPSPIARDALAEAARQVGTQENGKDMTIFGEWFGWNGVPWCNIFVSYCFAVGAGYVICESFAGRPGVKAGKGCAYVPTTAAWLRAEDMWKGLAAPLPGDLAVYNLDGGRQNHIGLVEEALGPRTFRAIEGNHGVAVARVQRTFAAVDGFGRVA